MRINYATQQFITNKDLLLEITAGARLRIKLIPEVDRKNI